MKINILVFTVSGIIGLVYALLTRDYSQVSTLGYLAVFAAAGVAGSVVVWSVLAGLHGLDILPPSSSE